MGKLAIRTKPLGSKPVVRRQLMVLVCRTIVPFQRSNLATAVAGCSRCSRLVRVIFILVYITLDQCQAKFAAVVALYTHQSKLVYNLEANRRAPAPAAMVAP